MVRSRGAQSMALLLARKKEEGGGKPGGCLEIALSPDLNRTGDLWHISVQVVCSVSLVWCLTVEPQWSHWHLSHFHGIHVGKIDEYFTLLQSS